VRSNDFRFVFIDGCESANGDLCIAFGIEKKKVDFSYYNKKKMPTRAFLGWKYHEEYKDVTTGVFSTYHSAVVTTFFNKWINGEPLADAISESEAEKSPPYPYNNTPIIWGDQNMLRDPRDEPSP